MNFFLRQNLSAYFIKKLIKAVYVTLSYSHDHTVLLSQVECKSM
jgi:hypothetical protein